MNISIKEKNMCCGCTACAAICSFGAIRMIKDDLGFDYPTVDENLCVDCGRCLDVCQFKIDYNRNNCYEEPIIFGIRSNLIKELEKSQSGAGFFIFSEFFLDNNGVVYGAITTTNSVCHIKASNKQDRDLMRGSKYIQSNLSNVFREIKCDLKHGRLVLFSGTPCQVAGLKSFVGKKYQNGLFTIDILCHGVGSPKVWKDYIIYIKNKYKSDVTSYLFRDKKYGWKNPVESFFSKGKKHTSTTFLDLYFSHCISRDCCSKCPFTNYNRVGDISLGDFWGWEKYHDYMHDNLGISLLFINTEKGNYIFKQIENNIVSVRTNREECKQQVLQYPTQHSPNREKFISEYLNKGFKFVVKKYTQEGWKLRWKIKIYSIIHPKLWLK